MPSLMGVEYGEIKLTQTMLNKHIIDANKSVQKVLTIFNHLNAGEKAVFDYEDFKKGKTAKLTCYKSKTRGDPRINVADINKIANIGETIGIFRRLPTNNLRFSNRPSVVLMNIDEWHDYLLLGAIFEEENLKYDYDI